MRLTPLDIRQHRFHRRLRGFDPDEVQVFLDAVIADFEEVVRENAQLRREGERVARELERFRSREHTIQETLTTAQQVVEQLKHTAIKESEVMISEAQIQAEKVRREAELRRTELQRDVTELEQVRLRAESEVRRALEDHLTMLDSYREIREGRLGRVAADTAAHREQGIDVETSSSAEGPGDGAASTPATPSSNGSPQTAEVPEPASTRPKLTA
jgi:cell division initiation protein